MTKLRTIADLVERGRTANLFGRDRELALLQELAVPGGPAVAYVHGPFGIGKSALLGALEALLATRGTGSVRIDGGAIEPQPEGLVAALCRACGAKGRTLSELVTAFAVARGTVVMIDDVDTLRLVSTWLRRELVPALPAETRLVLAGRLPPPAAWTTDFGPLFMPVPLRPLERNACLAALGDRGLDAGTVERVWKVSRGHPLSLQMALQAARVGALERRESLGELSDAIIAGSNVPTLRRMVQAAAIVRRVTRPLMAAMLGDDVLEGFDTFAALPFVELDREGHYLAEAVRRLQRARLASVEPSLHAGLRSAAVSWITNRLAAAGPGERWRYMADLLYLVEHPQVRDAFFPGESPLPVVEPAKHEDFASVLTICEARIGADERRIVERWAEILPHRFNVCRGSGGDVLAFYLCARGDDSLDDLTSADPLLAYWRADGARSVAPGRTLFMRQLLARDPSDAAPERAACMLDLKRYYFERWDLSRVYTAASAGTIVGPLMRRLGFRPLSQANGQLPGSMVLNLPGAGVVDWISALIGMTAEWSRPIDLRFARDRREIEVEGALVRLTRLEADVLALLIDRAPAVVTREELIDTVWRRAFVGSNVVDAVIRTLRRKLGAASGRIVTVPKSGYRYLNPGTALDEAAPSRSGPQAQA